MSDLSEIFQFLIRLVTFLFETLLDGFCLVMVVLAFAFPWRWCETYDFLQHKRIRECGLICFAITIIDCFAIPIFSLSILSPLRWSYAIKIIKECFQLNDLKDRIDHRFMAIIIGLFSLFEAFTFPFAILTLISPFGRQIALGYLIYTFSGNPDNDYDDDEYYCSPSFESTTFVMYGYQSIFDLIIGIFVPIVFLAPTMWKGMYQGLKLAWVHNQNTFTRSNARSMRSYYYNWMNDFRYFMGCRILHAIIDICVTPLFFFALCSPKRCRLLYQVLYPSPPPMVNTSNGQTTSPKPSSQANLPANSPANLLSELPSNSLESPTSQEPPEMTISGPLTPEQLQEALASNPTVVNEVAQIQTLIRPPSAFVPIKTLDDWDFQYNFELRQTIAYLGFLSITDIFVYPMLLPLYLTQYRFENVQEIFETTHMWGSRELYLITSQCLFLFLDIFCLWIPLLLLFITRVRWYPIVLFFQEQSMKPLLNRTFKCYQLMFFQLLLLFGDLFCSIPLFLVWVTRYQYLDIQYLVADEWIAQRGWRYHVTILLNFAYILLDVCIFLPLSMIVLLINPFRGMHIVRQVQIHQVHDKFNRWDQYIERNTANNTTNSSNNNTNTRNNLLTVESGGQSTPFISSPTPGETSQPTETHQTTQVPQQRSTREPITYYFSLDFLLPRFNTREIIATQIISTLIDFPFFFLGCLIVCTLWRTMALFQAMHNTCKEFCVHDTTVSPRVLASPIRRFQYTLIEKPGKIYTVIIEQFLSLLCDICCLIPMSILIVTIYRLPQLIIDLISKIGSQASLNTSLCTLTSISSTWEDGQDVELTMKLDGNTSQFTAEHFSSINKFKFHVLGVDLWNAIASRFGSFATSLVQSFLPVSVSWKEKTIQWIEQEVSTVSTVEVHAESNLQDDLHTNYEKLVDLPQNPQDLQGRQTSQPSQYHVKIMLPLKNFKKRALTKLLTKLYPSSGQIMLQLEGILPTSSTLTPLTASPAVDPSTTTSSSSNNLVIFRFVLTIEHLIELLQLGSIQSLATLPNYSNISAIIGQQTTFVDNFHLIILQQFLELCMDVYYFGLLVSLLCFQPFRFVQLMYNWFIASNLQYIASFNQLIGYKVMEMDYHLLLFRDKLNIILNSSVKDIYTRVLASNPRTSPYSQYYDAFSDKVDLIPKHALYTYDFARYLRLSAEITKLLTLIHPKSSSGTQQLAQIKQHIEELHKLYDTLFYHWIYKYSIYTTNFYKVKPSKDRLSLISMIVKEKIRQIVQSLQRCKQLIQQDIELAKSFCQTGKLQNIPLVSLENSIAGNVQSNPTHDPMTTEQPSSGSSTIQPTGSDNIQSSGSAQQGNETNKNNILPSMNTPAATPSTADKKAVYWLQTKEQQRLLLTYYVQEMLKDYYALMLFFILCLTLVRIPALVRDYLHQRKVFVQDHPLNIRPLIVKHMHLLATDLLLFAKFLGFSLILLITVVGIPNYLIDLTNHVHSLYDMKECGKKHVKHLFRSLCELLSLLTVFRTYRILFKASFYSLLLPSAGIADAIPHVLSVPMRFLSGLVVYVALTIGAIVVTLYANRVDVHHTLALNHSLLILGGSLAGFLLFIYLIKVKGLHTSQTTSLITMSLQNKQLLFCWNHICLLCKGPMICLQYSALIMYFYWNAVTISQSESVTTILTYETTGDILYGKDNLSQIMFWDQNTSFSIYQTMLTLAICMLFTWCILIAIPISQGGYESERQKKIMMVKNTLLYQLLFEFFSSMISIWLIMICLRPSSCINVNDQQVLSTNWQVMCGNGAEEYHWTMIIALPLLIHYVITSCLNYNDMEETNSSPTTTSTQRGHFNSLDLYNYDSSYGTPYNTAYDTSFNTTLNINNNNNTNNPTNQHERVIFHSSYLIGSKCMEICLCFGIFGAVGVAPAMVVLVPLICLLLWYACWPLCYSFSTQEKLCSLPMILPWLSASYLSVVWTCVVCLVRSFANTSDSFASMHIFATETTIYIGWGIIYLLGFLRMAYVHRYYDILWQQLLTSQGIIPIVEQMITTFDLIVSHSHDAQPPNIRQFMNQSIISKEMLRLRSFNDIITWILQIENMISLEKLSTNFLLHRSEWKQSLKNILSNAKYTILPMKLYQQTNQQLAAQSSRRSPSQQQHQFLSSNANEEDIENQVERTAPIANNTLITDSAPSNDNVTMSVVESTPNNRVNNSSQEILPVFGLLKDQIQLLQHEYTAALAATYVTRETLTLLLSTKLPSELCWLIFSYLTNLSLLHEVVFKRDDLNNQPSHEYYPWYSYNSSYYYRYYTSFSPRKWTVPHKDQFNLSQLYKEYKHNMIHHMLECIEAELYNKGEAIEKAICYQDAYSTASVPNLTYRPPKEPTSSTSVSSEIVTGSNVLPIQTIVPSTNQLLRSDSVILTQAERLQQEFPYLNQQEIEQSLLLESLLPEQTIDRISQNMNNQFLL